MVKPKSSWSLRSIAISHRNHPVKPNQLNVIEIELISGTKKRVLRFGKGSARWNKRTVDLQRLAKLLDQLTEEP